MAIWDHFESLVLQFLEDRTSELLTQGDVSPDPRLVARIREDAAFHAASGVARFRANNGAEKAGESAKNH